MSKAGSNHTGGASLVLSEEECRRILERAHGFAKGGGETYVSIHSWWHGELRWARNRASLSSDRRNINVSIGRKTEYGKLGYVSTNQLDDAALEAAVRGAERDSEVGAGRSGYQGFVPKFPEYRRPRTAPIWSDATVGLDTDTRARMAQGMIAPAEARGFYSAGYTEVRAAAVARYSTGLSELVTGDHSPWEEPYIRWTQTQCSTTVRDSSGMGSGWAGLSSYDADRIEAEALAARAVEKCRASLNPVAVEPGRYTVILEPQAVADLMELLVQGLARENPESSRPTGGPWRLGFDEAIGLMRSKLGLKVVDDRITIEHDPMDPRLGIVMSPHERPGPVRWIERGVLTQLGHYFRTGLMELGGEERGRQLRAGMGYRMSGGDTSMEEMIRTTRRGLLVTRFSGISGHPLDTQSLLTTGLTRDGLWLIENGEITRAVRNFRFTESPLFVLNSIEQLGEPVPVFRPTVREGEQLTPAIVPPIKARDFSFTSLVDAV